MLSIQIVVASVLVAGGKPLANVSLEGATENAQLRYASHELTNWVGKITGAALPVNGVADCPVVVHLGTPGSSRAIAAFAAKHKADFSKLTDNDGFILAEEDGDVYVAAAKTKGVLNGVYRFLEKNSDIIWARAMEGEDGFGTVYSKISDFKNSIKYFVDIPSIKQSRFWASDENGPWRAPYPFTRWEARLLNSWFPVQAGTAEADPKKERFRDTSVQRKEFGLRVVNKYMKSDPDIFPLRKDGSRSMNNDHQLCFMNPKTARLMAKEMLPFVKTMPQEVKYLGLGLGDNWDLCHCDYCKKSIVLPDGKELPFSADNFRSTQYAIFCNRVTEILQRECPKCPPVHMMCYVFNAAAPAVRCRGGSWLYAPYVKNHKKPVFDDSVNAVWHARAESFRRVGQPFRGLYEYYLCDVSPRFYNAICEVAQQDINYYLPDLTECYVDAGYQDDPNRGRSLGFDMSAIEYWTLARLMWNSKIDVKTTRREYCRRAYRDAGEIMGDYYEKLAANYNDDPIGAFWNDAPENGARHYIVEKGLSGWVRETLAKAEATASHPSSKELIRRHALAMTNLIARAERIPRRIELAVPQVVARPDFDLSGAFWSKAAKLEPITAVSKGDKALGDAAAIVKAAHDRENLYVMMACRNAKYRQMYDKRTPYRKGDEFVWDTPFEFYIDGDLADKGGYHFFSARFNGHRFTGIGPTPDAKDPPWSVAYEPMDRDGYKILITIPLSSVGIEITKQNRFGVMFIAPHCAWNGGQWHNPSSFQTFRLEMQ